MANEYAEGLSGAQYQQAQLDANARAERQPISVWDEENPDPGAAPVYWMRYLVVSPLEELLPILPIQILPRDLLLCMRSTKRRNLLMLESWLLI